MVVFNYNDHDDVECGNQYQFQSVTDEEELRTWIQRQPDLLGEHLLIIGRESDFGKGRIDLLALDQFGNTVIVEVKQGDTVSESTSQDKIIGQPMRYAASVRPLSYSELNEEYKAYQREISVQPWASSENVEDDLEEVFHEEFGRELTKVNNEQRMVIVAEDVALDTTQTLAQHQSKGMNIQCREIQHLAPPNGGQEVVTSTATVDYDPFGLKPKQYGSSVDYTTVEWILERAFPDVRDTLGATNSKPLEVGFDGESPGLRSNRRGHPDSIRYKLYLRPEEWGWVGVGIDVTSDEGREAVEENSEEFAANGFELNQETSRERIAVHGWDDVDTHSGMTDARAEIAGKYVELIELGHELLVPASEQ